MPNYICRLCQKVILYLKGNRKKSVAYLLMRNLLKECTMHG